jgi:hypothetical protein
MVKGCPEGMYPLDSTYGVGEEFTDVDEFKECVTKSGDSLNVLLSWYFTEAGEDDGKTPAYLDVVYVMPRKGCSTWSVRLVGPAAQQAELEPWLKVVSKMDMTTWFGWDES